MEVWAKAPVVAVKDVASLEVAVVSGLVLMEAEEAQAQTQRATAIWKAGAAVSWAAWLAEQRTKLWRTALPAV